MATELNDLPLEELFEKLVDPGELQELIHVARGEDLDDEGDITSQLMIRPEVQGRAAVRSRGAGVLAGGVLIESVAMAYDPDLKVTTRLSDGVRLNPGDVIAEIEGPLRSMLAAERVVLNFVTFLSGVATLTANYVERVKGTEARIFDTRKTVPGLRSLSKYAVRCGGGFCHRIGLFDAVLIKDNHLAASPHGSWRDALQHALQDGGRLSPTPKFVEVEVDTLEQLQQVLPLGADVILLDNMTADQLREAVSLRDRMAPDVQLEASGGVNLQTVHQIAESGVDRIAIGALTHSAPALDIGLDLEA